MNKAITIFLSGVLVACGVDVIEVPSPSQPAPIEAQSVKGIKTAIQQVFRNQFAKQDKDRDGFLTFTETGRSKDLCQKADVDKDGKISLKEFLTLLGPEMDKQVTYIREQAQTGLTKFDLDGDRVISLDEFQKSETAKEIGIWGFRFGDRNQDQKLTLSEWEDVVAWQVAHVAEGQDAPPPAPAMDEAPQPKPVPTATPSLTPDNLYWYNPNQMGYGVTNPYGMGYGTGYGSTYGTGYGSTYGTGYGTGYGSTYGSTYGAGYGSTYGTGYGTGYGSTYGTGYGAGYGSTYGTGYGTNYGSTYGTGYGAGYGSSTYGNMSPYDTFGNSYGTAYGDPYDPYAAPTTARARRY